MSRIPKTLLASLILTLFGASVALAQPPPASPTAERLAEARAGVAKLGKHWSPEINAETERLYAVVHRGIDSSGIQQKSDISYGPDPQQTFDLFVPDGGFTEPSLVLIYLHGGELSRGDKRGESGDGLVYGNVARFIARVGGIGINANYRLAPGAKWPSGADDVRLLLEWVRKNIGPYGGDTSNVILMGTSVGATHIATYLLKEDSQLDDGLGVSAAILASGAFGDFGDVAGAREYFGKRAAARTPLRLVDSYRGKTVPILLWSGEYDVASVEADVAQMYARLRGQYPGVPTLVALPGHNRVSSALSFDTGDLSVMGPVMRFYHTVR
jgi:acetyl esterase/lipase